MERRRVAEEPRIGFDLGKGKPQVFQGQDAVQILYVRWFLGPFADGDMSPC